MLIAVVVCSFIPGERLNLGPFERMLISWVLRPFVRSVTKSTLSWVVSSGSFVFCGSVVSCGLSTS